MITKRGKVGLDCDIRNVRPFAVHDREIVMKQALDSIRDTRRRASAPFRVFGLALMLPVPLGAAKCTDRRERRAALQRHASGGWPVGNIEAKEVYRPGTTDAYARLPSGRGRRSRRRRCQREAGILARPRGARNRPVSANSAEAQAD
jgi:hypothetical protein